MMLLIDIVGASEATGALRTFRFCEGPGGYITKPTDTPANAYYAPAINQSGLYNATLFGTGGKTSGAAVVDRGEIILNNTGGKLDELDDYAFDGYDLTIYSLDTIDSAYSSRERIATATIETISITEDEIRLGLRSRLAILDKPIQTGKYKGTTVNGSLIEAEGDQNLKDTPKLLMYGAPIYVQALLLNAFYGVFGIADYVDAIDELRDRGTILQPSNVDYPTAQQLINANVPVGYWASCRAQGLIRIGGNNVSEVVLYVKAKEGATAAARTAGQIVKRILINRAGLVLGQDFLQSDIDALDAVAPDQVGYWSNQDSKTILDVVSDILNSVGAYISPNKLGVFRIRQMPLPQEKTSVIQLTEVEFIAEQFQRLVTGDDDNGIPPSSFTIKHSYNYAQTSKDSLTGNAQLNEPQFVSFIEQEWRQVVLQNPTVHKLAKDMPFETLLISDAAAQVYANRQKLKYGTKRKRFEVPVHFRYSRLVDLADVVTLQIDRFGLNTGQNFVIVGKREDLDSRVTVLDVWG